MFGFHPVVRKITDGSGAKVDRPRSWLPKVGGGTVKLHQVPAGGRPEGFGKKRRVPETEVFSGDRLGGNMVMNLFPDQPEPRFGDRDVSPGGGKSPILAVENLVGREKRGLTACSRFKFGAREWRCCQEGRTTDEGDKLDFS